MEDARKSHAAKQLFNVRRWWALLSLTRRQRLTRCCLVAASSRTHVRRCRTCSIALGAASSRTHVRRCRTCSLALGAASSRTHVRRCRTCSIALVAASSRTHVRRCGPARCHVLIRCSDTHRLLQPCCMPAGLLQRCSRLIAAACQLACCRGAAGSAFPAAGQWPVAIEHVLGHRPMASRYRTWQPQANGEQRAACCQSRHTDAATQEARSRSRSRSSSITPTPTAANQGTRTQQHMEQGVGVGVGVVVLLLLLLLPIKAHRRSNTRSKE